MLFRFHRISSTIPSLASASSTIPVRQHITQQSQRRFARSTLHCPKLGPRLYHTGPDCARNFHKQSASGLLTAAVVVGIAIGGALLFPYNTTTTPAQHTHEYTSSAPCQFTNSPDSYLIMAPNMPPGRPGTLTAEQEIKLRELWALTMKVFGVYEPATPELNGTETPLSPPSESTETTSPNAKKEKKKSRLNVFRRHKGDKDGGESETTTPTPSGTATPSDISSLSLADDDDKHGQNKDFKAAIANSAPEDLRKTFWSMVKHDHPDALLLRFLRARKWDVEKALVMLISTMHWRAEDMHVDDDIMRHGEAAMLADTQSADPKVRKEAEDFLSQMRMGKSYLHGVDKEGRPMCVVRTRLHRQGEQSEKSLERFTVYTIETARMILRPPVDTATIVFDMTNFSMANMDYTPVKFMIKCFEANYPESLGAVLVYKAPWVFNAIWTIIRGWLDPVVAGKVHFVKGPDDLETFVPRSQIPAELGGDEKWEYTYTEPQPSEVLESKEGEGGQKDEILAKRSELVRRYEGVVLDWIHEGENTPTSSTDSGESGNLREGLEKRRKERDTLAEELRSNYWKLDPFVRAKSLYDRTGMILPEGKLDFYPQKKVEVSPPAGKKEVETSQDDLD
ncbi:hypothetical protein BCR34DRAFT_483331 [Clohesyomyces aquaticus]|uniref:CRAL-TRIO domain-containing protein n=1 Tax=Clohesyomyces aquaticus TaxID=1231657 RepID=A0A1Y1ZP22_9PLEO|nr:hypothetical protein BCR34DRAFT_483331 [Clohesyomyces aquaticus]